MLLKALLTTFWTALLADAALDVRSPSTGASACAAIAKCFSLDGSTDKLLTPSSDQTAFAQAQNGGRNPINNELRPTCIVQPTTTDDVSRAMKAIFSNDAHYAVRAGGHTGMYGWDAVSGGVLIDYSNMTDYSYDANSQTISIQPGLRWGQVNEMSEPYGVAPLGGRVSDVGTGLLLGGGLSFLSPQHGYACDGLVSADVVLVDGTVRHVTSASDPTLMRAIKGGGGRFGIITRYQLQAFDTGRSTDKRWWGGSLTYATPDAIDQLFQAAESFVAAKDDTNAYVLVNAGMIKLPLPTYIGVAYVFYQGNAAQFTDTFKDFLAIPGVIPLVGPQSYPDISKTIGNFAKGDQPYKWIGGSLYPKTTGPTRPTSYLKLWTDSLAFINANLDTLSASFLSITPVKTTQIEQGYANGGNAISPPRGRNYMHWLFSTTLAQGSTSFPQDLDDKRLAFIKSQPSDEGLPLFLNEVDSTQPTFKSYGWYQELRNAYARYDPTSFSLKRQNGPSF